MPLQILLHYIATHGVAYNYRGAIETIGGGQHVSHVVLNGASIERLFCLALTMPTKTDRCSTKTFVGEEVQKMLVPGPGAMPATMNKKQWHRVRGARAPLSITSSVGADVTGISLGQSLTGRLSPVGSGQPGRFERLPTRDSRTRLKRHS